MPACVSFLKKLSLENETKAMSLLVDMCTDILAQFCTNIPADIALLKERSDSLSFRAKMAIEYRLEEKRIIWKLSQYLQSRLERLLDAGLPAPAPTTAAAEPEDPTLADCIFRVRND